MRRLASALSYRLGIRITLSAIGLYANYSIWMQQEQVAGMEKIWADIW